MVKKRENVWNEEKNWTDRRPRQEGEGKGKRGTEADINEARGRIDRVEWSESIASKGDMYPV